MTPKLPPLGPGGRARRLCGFLLCHTRRPSDGLVIHMAHKKIFGSSWGLSLRLALSFALLIVAMVGVGWLGIAESYRSQHQLEALSDEASDERSARKILTYSNINARILLEILSTNDTRTIDALLARRDENSRTIDSILGEMWRSTETPGERELIERIQERRTAYRADSLAALNTWRDGQPEQARTLIVATVLPRLTEYHEALNQYISFQEQRARELETALDVTTTRARHQTIALIAIVVVIASGLAVFVAVNIGRHIGRRVRAEEALHTAHRELETRIAERTSDLIAANEQLQKEIASRRSVEEELRASQDRYRQIVESAKDMIYRLTPSGRVTFANAAAAKLVGRPADECVGMHFLSFTRKDFRAQALSFYREQVERKTPITYLELPLATQDNSETWVGQNVQLIFEGDKVLEVQAVSRDVTQRKLVENQLLESEQRYRDLFTFAPLGIYQSALDGSIVTANKEMAHILGYESVDELMKLNIARDIYCDPNERQRLVDAYDPRGYASELELKWKKKDGKPIWIELTAHSVRHHEEPTEHFEGYVRDVTARKRMEYERQVIADIIQGVIATTDLDELLALVHREISKCLYAENCFVALSDDDTKLVRYPFWVDKLDPCPDPRPPGVGFSGCVLRTGQPMLVSPELTEEMSQRGEVEKSGSSSKSWLGVPLKTPTRTIGVLVVQHYEEENAYDESDLEFLSSVGSQIALAIERKRAEQAIQDSEERYHQLVELSPDAIIIHQDENFAFANTAAVQLADVGDASDLIGQSIFTFIAPEFHQLVRERVAQIYLGQTPQPAEIQTSRFDGSVVDCEIAAVPFTHRERRAVLAVIRDISERKRVQVELEEANRRALTDYERLVEKIAVLGQTLANERDLTKILRALREFTVLSVPCDGLVICLYNRETETRRVVYCWVDEHEVEPSEVEDIPVGEGMVGRAIKTSTVIIDNNYEQSMLHKQATVVGVCEGDQYPKSALTAPMTVLGRTIGCVEVQTYEPSAYRQEHATAMRMAASLAASAIENVTLAEREHEKGEQLRQAQKMEAVGRLAGGVAHDFNNLLTVINGYSDLTLRSLESQSPLRSRIEEIKKAGERAASLTRQLLAFSRKQMLQPRVLDLNTIIAEVDKMLRRLIGEDVLLETRLDPSLGQVKADPGQIEQILMNLVVNARDALPVGGHITIGTRNRYLDRTRINGQEVVKPGHYVVLSVSDDGCGMDSQTQKKIFEPFFTTKEFGKGTGLGLSTVYGIVKQSEGSIWVYSELGKGTTFNIYLPRVDELTAPEEMGETKQPAAAGRETVLLVEDEPMVRALAREVLEQYGYTVISAADGQEGLDICKAFAGRIDLIITDVVMPRMSGRELAESVASVRPDARILYMSGFTDDAIVRHGMLDKDFPFIQKPFSPELLASKTRELLDA